ncbi:pentatricopeptide repeat-containing protein At4g21300 [Amborella trichopoda]|uniref:pentatricopeptide repeat-containing protein At4g21300 n=1 Tax=Amborella trichopoda TaxID=13333 RepID=UPI0009C06F2C|nr:pentatricopeptide repeat-containing protein At4g21300 [Amborella trichopoda]XP_020523941.1 pentatricopeptide repeat-containing protein At4g21300 [Amborella trichopoda]XP_020523942.1 pentatricopeptide repeat-containing protein At4g21300 [Amborella trichopoda]|eukprot:XP_011624041.2 pentatricopeptide repeat-containing protein At4g21300 [Amborella trichopoda]
MTVKLLCSRYNHILSISSTNSKTLTFKLCRRMAHVAQSIIEHSDTHLAQSYVEPHDLEHGYSVLLKSCSEPSFLKQGRQIHAQILTQGMGFMNIKVLCMYVLTRTLFDALKLFHSIDRRHPMPWNWIIRGFILTNNFEFGLLFYLKMLGFGIQPDSYTFTYVIKACCSLSAISIGRLIHESMVAIGFELDLFVGSSLMKLYAENGCIEGAVQVFNEMRERDCVLWNVIITGHAKHGDVNGAFRIFQRMMGSDIKPNSVTFSCVLSMCATSSNLDHGIQLHGHVIRCGFEYQVSISNTLLAMYSKCHCLLESRQVFKAMNQKDLVSYNGMIAGYVQNGYADEALSLFYEMQSVGLKPDSVTFASILPSFSDLAGLIEGKAVHSYIIRNGVHLDAFVKSALIDIYCKCRDALLARKVFDRTGYLDVVICSAMISGYVLNGMSYDALEIFRGLEKFRLKPNSVTLSSILPACSALASLRLGKQLHNYILKNGFEARCYIGSALTDMYAKCGRVDLSFRVFDRLPERDSVAWNSMITSCAQNGQPEEALKLIRRMSLEGVGYDCVTISAGLSACAGLPAMLHGKEIHGFMIKGSFRSDIFAKSALIDMYAKCGALSLARSVFDIMRVKNEVSWNSMIAAYGIHGHVKEALLLFQEMVDSGILPDQITFLAVISSCGHAGLVEEGLQYFNSMTKDYGIMARMEHYSCMVDLLGRAGHLKEAMGVIENMPFEPDAGIWGALLGACRVHGNVELAELASKHLFELDPGNSGYYVILANIHAEAGRWESVLRVRSLMKERGVQKLPGCSWIDLNSTTHMFVAADGSHPECAQIYLISRVLILELKEAGYVPRPELC